MGKHVQSPRGYITHSWSKEHHLKIYSFCKLSYDQRSSQDIHKGLVQSIQCKQNWSPFISCEGDSKHDHQERSSSRLSSMILFLDHLRLAQQDVQYVSETVGPLNWKGSAFVALWLMSPVHIRCTIWTPLEVRSHKCHFPQLQSTSSQTLVCEKDTCRIG